MRDLIFFFRGLPTQAETVVNTVSKAYENDVLIGTIALLVVAVLGLFGLLLRSYRDRAVELKAINAKHEEAIKAMRESNAARSKEQDERIYTLLERVTSALVNVSNTVSNFTDELRALRGGR